MISRSPPIHIDDILLRRKQILRTRDIIIIIIVIHQKWHAIEIHSSFNVKLLESEIQKPHFIALSVRYRVVDQSVLLTTACDYLLLFLNRTQPSICRNPIDVTIHKSLLFNGDRMCRKTSRKTKGEIGNAWVLYNFVLLRNN